MNWEERARRTGAYIRDTQLASGAIPWFEGDKTDPWNHVESAMGLSIAGRHEEAERAYAWLASNQLDNGAWFAAYDDSGTALTNRIESNFVGYIATGVWHHYLVTGNRAFLSDYWPTVRNAIDYVCGLQAPTGEIYWAEDFGEGVSEDALVTGCSSIFRSIGAARDIAAVLGEPTGRWLEVQTALGETLRDRPERFDRTWESKSRFAMDWFYPVMCGAFDRKQGLERLRARHNEFVHPELGCRCVVEEPWVTIAETSELVMAYAAVGEHDIARVLFDNLSPFQAENGAWWTGYQFAERVLWPDERPTWTAGAVLLAMDAVHGCTPAHRLFSAQ